MIELNAEQEILKLTDHIAWCKEQIELAEAALCVLLIVTLGMVLIAVLTGYMRRRTGGRGEVAFALSSLASIILVISILLTAVAISWQYPGEISAAERAIEQLEALL